MHVVGIFVVVLTRYGCGRHDTGTRRCGNQLLAEFVDRGFVLFVIALTDQRRRVFPTLGRQHDVDDRSDEHERRGEGVDADTGEFGRRVATHQLDQETARTVAGDIQREQAAMTELELPVRPDQQRENEQVPQ